MADPPIAALIKDLKQRGLLDETLVVWGASLADAAGENRGGRALNTGRDHHPFGLHFGWRARGEGWIDVWRNG